MATYKPVGTDNILDILSEFQSLHKEQLIKYIQEYELDITREQCENSLLSLSKTRNIHISESGICTLFKGQSTNYNSISAFAIILKLCNGQGKIHIAKSKYPTEFIIENNGNLYELIDMTSSDESKILFRNKALRTNDFSIPVFYSINKEIIIPPEDIEGKEYIIANLDIDYSYPQDAEIRFERIVKERSNEA